MIPPRLMREGASGLISRAIRSLIEEQGLSCSPIRFRTGSSEDEQICCIGSIADRATRSCIISRGVILPTATLEIIRSTSPISMSCCSISSLMSGSLKKYSTTFNRSLIGCTSFKGKTIHLFSRRAPIGLVVRSMTSSKLFPPSFIVFNNSRLRTVNLSRRT